MNCAGCFTLIDDDEVGLQCSVVTCKKTYHLLCAGGKNAAEASNSTWVCPECSCSAKKGGDNSLTPVGFSKKSRDANVTIRKNVPSLSSKCGDGKRLEKDESPIPDIVNLQQELSVLRQLLTQSISVTKINDARMESHAIQMEQLQDKLKQYEAANATMAIEMKRCMSQMEIIGTKMSNISIVASGITVTPELQEGKSPKIKLQDVGTPNAITSQHTPALPSQTQCPVRPARAAATVAFALTSKKGNTAATQKLAGKPRPFLGDQVKTTEVTRYDIPPTTTDPSTMTTSGVATNHAVTLADGNKTYDDTYATDAGWQKVTKKPRKREVVNGTGKTDDILQAVERLKYIQAWQFKPDTTEKNILDYLNKLQNCDRYYVEKRQTKSSWHAVFIIGIPESYYGQISAPTSWPAGIRVSNWIFRARASAGGGSQ